METHPTHARDYERIERAIAFLVENAGRAPSLEETAAHVASSPWHFQRTFRRWAGTTPKRFLRHLAAERLRARLREAPSVLAAALDGGVSGPGRLHDLMVTVRAVTPGEVRSGGVGLTIRHGVGDTPFGPARVALTARGILALEFLASGAEEASRALDRDWPRARFVEDPAAARDCFARIAAQAEGSVELLPVVLRGTNLQLRVWEALLRIPAGEVVSYGALAGAVGRPGAARAVAGAVAANRVAWLIPCHRVLRASGAVGGYRWGVARKWAMLGREAAAGRRPKRPPVGAERAGTAYS